MSTEKNNRPEFRVIALLVFGGVIALGIIGIVVLLHFRPDASATLISALQNLLTTLSGFAVLAYGLHSVSRKVEKVETQTNGQLSSRDEEIRRLNDELIAAKEEIASKK